EDQKNARPGPCCDADTHAAHSLLQRENETIGHGSPQPASVARECAGGFGFEIQVRFLTDVDPDAEDGSALEGAWRLVFLAHVVAAVAADAQAIATEGELADLRTHRPAGDDLVVDIQLRGADRFLVFPRRLPDELDAEHVLAGADLGRRREPL